MVKGSRAKIRHGQTVKAIFGQSKILTAVTALDTVPIGVTPLAVPSMVEIFVVPFLPLDPKFYPIACLQGT